MQQEILALTKQGTEMPDDPENWSVLIIDGQNKSASMSECVESTGYDERAVYSSVDNESVEKAYDELRLVATNEWVQCVHEHGYPQISDAVMPDDPLNEDPIALLPTSVTESGLRLLLQLCPNFIVSVEKNNQEIWNRVSLGEVRADPLPIGLKGQPNVGFDYPGFNGDINDTRWPTGVEAEQIRDKLEKLVAILDEPVDAYLSEGDGE